MTDSVFNIHIETENGNYEWGASQVLVLLSNYYSNKKLFDENRDGYGNILILKDASIISKSSIIPDLLKGDIVENNNIEYIKVCNIKISSDVELESDVDGDKSDKLPVDIKILGNHIEVFSFMTKGILMKAPNLFTVDEQLEIQERLKSNDIEVAFLRDDQIQASFYSFIEILVNNDFLNELEIALCVDILKDIIIKIISKIKKRT